MPYCSSKIICQILRSQGTNKSIQFGSHLSKTTNPIAAMKSLRVALFRPGSFFNEIGKKSPKEVHLKMLSAKYQPFCSGPNLVTHWPWWWHVASRNLVNIEPGCTKPLSEPILIYCKLETGRPTLVKFEAKYENILLGKCIEKCCLYNVGNLLTHWPLVDAAAILN